MTVFVTGGLGYIGSHTVVLLVEKGYDVIIADNLSNSSIETLDKLKKITKKNITFYKIDVADEIEVKKVFDNNNITAVIHFAGFKAVGESVEKPLMYYENNLKSTMVLAKLCTLYKINKFVFSSSATVYGEAKPPVIETMDSLEAKNPYGQTKIFCETILKDISKSNENFKVIILRYFNPVGAHKSALIGENPFDKPNNLLPFITKVAKREIDKLYVFGDDYNTIDGTGVRDYIHVMDLAKGHILALENIKSGFEIYNLGTGKGYSVLEIIETFKKVNNIDLLPYEIVGRRAGDIDISFADTNKVYKKLGFKCEYDLKDMCKDAWLFEKNLASEND